MKVFVYNKNDSKCIQVIKDVKRVAEAYKIIRIYTDDEIIVYNTKYVKTRIYQN